MLSALYGVWAAYAGDRSLSAKLMEDGYGRFCVGRFMQTLDPGKTCFQNSLARAPSLQTWVDFSLASSLDSRDFGESGRCSRLGAATGNPASRGPRLR